MNHTEYGNLHDIRCNLLLKFMKASHNARGSNEKHPTCWAPLCSVFSLPLLVCVQLCCTRTPLSPMEYAPRKYVKKSNYQFQFLNGKQLTKPSQSPTLIPKVHYITLFFQALTWEKSFREKFLQLLPPVGVMRAKLWLQWVESLYVYKFMSDTMLLMLTNR